jgi:hypothetical protein
MNQNRPESARHVPILQQERLTVRIPKSALAYLRFILEAYDGLAQLSALPGRAEVTLLAPLQRVEELDDLLVAISDELTARGEAPLVVLARESVT